MLLKISIRRVLNVLIFILDIDFSRFLIILFIITNKSKVKKNSFTNFFFKISIKNLNVKEFFLSFFIIIQNLIVQLSVDNLNLDNSNFFLSLWNSYTLNAIFVI